MNVVWDKISNNDFACLVDDYVLRVEKMGKNWWWWGVSHKKEDVSFWFDYPRATTELEAKLLAELTFLKYKYENETFAKMA